MFSMYLVVDQELAVKQAMTKKGKRKSSELEAPVNDGNDVDFLVMLVESVNSIHLWVGIDFIF